MRKKKEKPMLHRNVQTAKITAVLCLLCMFVLSGIHKIMHFDTTVKKFGIKSIILRHCRKCRSS